MQAEYGRTIRSAYRRKTLSNPLLFLLSAESLNQAFRRWLFLRKYDEYRRKQADAIVFTKEMLAKKSGFPRRYRRDKENLLIIPAQPENDAHRGNVQQKRPASNAGTGRNPPQVGPATQGSRARSAEPGHRTRHPGRSAQTRGRVAARTRPAAPSRSNANTSTAGSIATEPATVAEEDNTSRSFSQRRGQLPWPVDDGFISRSFGRQKHPTLKNIEITNNGIDIRTEESAAVHAVFEGRVAGVQFIPGHDYTVILQHGNYYTVYSNLAETSVAKGDMVKSRQQIGRVSNNTITGASNCISNSGTRKSG